MNSFMATGGDGFSVFTEGAGTVGGALDVDAMLDYLQAHPVVHPPATVRVKRL
jgi:5'-nucleotidase